MITKQPMSGQGSDQTAGVEQAKQGSRQQVCEHEIIFGDGVLLEKPWQVTEKDRSKV